mgnify:FL=1
MPVEYEGVAGAYTGEAGNEVERKGLLSVMISPGFSNATSERSEAADFFLINGPGAKILLFSVSKEPGIPLVSLSLSFGWDEEMTVSEAGVRGRSRVCSTGSPCPYADTLLGVPGTNSLEP